MAGKRDEVTIAEVAEALNISKTTVSRAISGKGRVSEATRARVFDYIGKGRQDAAAPLRTAQQGPTNNLALVIPKHFMRLDLPFLRKCMGGVWNMAAQRGYDLLLCYAGETDVGQLERQLESHKVDGVICPVRCCTMNVCRLCSATTCLLWPLAAWMTIRWPRWITTR